VTHFHRLGPWPTKQKLIQQVELVNQPFLVTEHRAQGYWWRAVNVFHYAAFPPEVLAAGFVARALTSLVCYLKGKLHGSYSGLQDFFSRRAGSGVSRGYLAKLKSKGRGKPSPSPTRSC